ncbi:MAG: hypothetical protein V2I67_03580 [Thermoanaerobaculales bacterium]|jgi:hypothetical protein|nr:hypothetical protein [Thermoanaerobaculales bacterium]
MKTSEYLGFDRALLAPGGHRICEIIFLQAQSGAPAPEVDAQY